MGLKNSFCGMRGVDPTKPCHLRAVPRPALLSGAVLGCWWLFWDFGAAAGDPVLEYG